MFYVYAIQSSMTSRVYVGQTQDIDSRLAAHNSGTVNYSPAPTLEANQVRYLRNARSGALA